MNLNQRNSFSLDIQNKKKSLFDVLEVQKNLSEVK